LYTALFYKAGVPEAGKTSIPLSLSLSPSLHTAKPVFSLALSTLAKGRRFCQRVERQKEKTGFAVWRLGERETFTGV
jgi:hypothetical protein